MLTIATFNINKRLPNLLAWLERERPDVACLQELKCTDREFPVRALSDAGYGAIWHGEQNWNGVAILARGVTPIETRRGLPGQEDDAHARYIEAAVSGVLIGNLYLPNGNPIRGPKFRYKLAWFESLVAYASGLFSSGHPVVLAGDYNVVPTDEDIYNPKSWRRDALMQPESRGCYRRLLDQGWLDALRARHPARIYTFWDYFRNHWERDAGLRIDHVLLSATIAPLLLDAGVHRWVRGERHASDHAPTWITLDVGVKKRRARARTKETPPPRSGAKKRR